MLKEVKEFLKDDSVIYIVAFSGGKDSVAQFLYLLELGIPKERIHLHHHDVDGGESFFDWACTKSYCDAFAKAFGVKMLHSYRDKGILGEIKKVNSRSGDIYFQEDEGEEYRRLETGGKENTRLMFPAVSGDLRTRWCSAIAKIDVMARAITNNSKYYNEGKYVICTGERREESNNRKKYKELELHKTNSKKRNVYQWRPIIDWKESEVWEIMEKYKIQPHPCYELGWGRCSCQICIFSSKNVWQTVKEIDPFKILKLSQLEVQIDHTLKHKKKQKDGVVSIQKISILEYMKDGVNLIDEKAKERWLDEALGEFVSPIIVKGKWKLPAGAYRKESSGAT